MSTGLVENSSMRNLLVGYVSGVFAMSPGGVEKPKHAKSTLLDSLLGFFEKL